MLCWHLRYKLHGNMWNDAATNTHMFRKEFNNLTVSTVWNIRGVRGYPKKTIRGEVLDFRIGTYRNLKLEKANNHYCKKGKVC